MMTMSTVTGRTSARSDLPTMVLHWSIVVGLGASLLTGWRIARLDADGPILHQLDALLLQGNVTRWHFISATLLAATMSAYIALLWRLKLGARLRVRAAGLGSKDANTRWQSINRLLYWFAFLLLAGATTTGVMLYFMPGTLPSAPVATLHRALSWAFVPYVVLHVLAQLVRGGLAQLLKIVKPRLTYGVGGAFALAVGTAGAAVAYLADRSSIASLPIMATRTVPVLDGRHEDDVWSRTREVVVNTGHGANFEGGEVPVRIRALHDGKYAYFLFRWPDSTFSQKHIPLMKTAQGWSVVNSAYAKNDENDYYEDKFAVMLARSPIVAGNTTQLGNRPVADKPGPTNGLGLHATTDGSIADVWHWKSVRSGSLNQFDDNYFGPPVPSKPGERYTGGYAQDPHARGGFDQNFTRIAGSEHVKPKVLPRDLAAQLARQGRFNADPNISDEGVFAMKREDTVPYSVELDALIPPGTVIPSVVLDGPFEGDRGDVAAHATWKDGWWTIEARRLLDTGSRWDQPITDGIYLWVSVFDHNQVRHTRHIQPLRLVMH
jgi:hypothetical protein